MTTQDTAAIVVTGAAAAGRAPEFSVVVPARNCPDVLARSLGALRASDVASSAWELIVVDDGSTDATPEVAARFADRVVRLGPGPRGPAFARNRGVEQARGEYLVFVDSDVCVHSDALGKLVAALRHDSDVVAVFGAYDTSPPERGLVSQYRNLLHHYVHWINAGPATTFWAGCGAVRRDAFVAVGMFDERRFPRPQIEDIEVGYRLTARGHTIQLSPDIQGTHLKRWTFGKMLATDFSDRAVPWMRLLLEGGPTVRAGTLNVKKSERMLTILSGTALLLGVLSLVTLDWRYAVVALFCAAAVVIGNLPLLTWFARERGTRFAIAVIPLRLLFYLLSGVGAIWAILLHVVAISRTGLSLREAAS